MGYEVPGELAIWLALSTNILAGTAFVLTARGSDSFRSLAHRAYLLFTILVSLAVAYLCYLFFSHNFAFKYVFEYSRRGEPFFYTLSGFWGGQEGTYLLWLFFSALCGYLIIRQGGSYKDWAMAVFSVVNLFLLLLLVKLSPFALLPVLPADGLGLNPLLRDPWMVVHPPAIFIGYALAGVPFAIAMAALIRGDYSRWVTAAFPWVVICSLLLGLGNVLGGYWAYKTLGWGGYWAWDPVENSSLVPWLVALALVHGLIIGRRTGALVKTNLLLTASVFLLVVYATFLTRSGVLGDFSVHSFTDLGINVLLIAFMLLFAAITLILLLVRVSAAPSAPLRFNYFGREFFLYVAMALLLILGVIVLFWSSLPIITGVFSSEPRAADVATYNSFALPLAVIIAFLVGVSPFLSYTEYRLPQVSKRVTVTMLVSLGVGIGVFYFVLSAGLAFSILFTLVAGGAGVLLFKSDLRKAMIPGLVAFLTTVAVAVLLGVRDYLHVLFFAVAAMAAVSNLVSLIGYLPRRWKLSGGQLTHFGFGVMLIGVLASSAFDSDGRVILPREERGFVHDLAVEYQGMSGDIMQPGNELILSVDDGTGVVEVRPQLYFSERMNGVMRQPYISRSLLSDMYFAPEQVQNLESADGLRLRKGEVRRVGDFELSFEGFELEGHEQPAAGSLRVFAEITVDHDDETATIRPSVVHSEDVFGNHSVQSEPAQLVIAGQQYEVSIDRILADEKMVVIQIPALAPASPPDRLVLDVSRKPMINLVWAGTTLILLGSLIAFIRRRGETVGI